MLKIQYWFSAVACDKERFLNLLFIWDRREVRAEIIWDWSFWFSFISLVNSMLGWFALVKSFEGVLGFISLNSEVSIGSKSLTRVNIEQFTYIFS